jgi:hypothetical protein
MQSREAQRRLTTSSGAMQMKRLGARQLPVASLSILQKLLDWNARGLLRSLPGIFVRSFVSIDQGRSASVKR